MKLLLLLFQIKEPTLQFTDLILQNIPRTDSRFIRKQNRIIHCFFAFLFSEFFQIGFDLCNFLFNHFKTFISLSLCMRSPAEPSARLLRKNTLFVLNHPSVGNYHTAESLSQLHGRLTLRPLAPNHSRKYHYSLHPSSPPPEAIRLSLYKLDRSLLFEKILTRRSLRAYSHGLVFHTDTSNVCDNCVFNCQSSLDIFCPSTLISVGFFNFGRNFFEFFHIFLRFDF